MTDHIKGHWHNDEKQDVEILNYREMVLSAHVWKFVAACANEEDDMKQAKTTGWYTLKWWVGIKDLV